MIDLISLDTETTGLIPGRHQVLSIAAIHLASRKTFYAETKWSEMVVSREALSVNKWDFSRDADREIPGKVASDFSGWLQSIVPPGTKLRSLGHNVRFDVEMVQASFGRTFDLSHRVVDINSLYSLLAAANGIDYSVARKLIQDGAKISLGESDPITSLFGKHHALYDAWLAVHEWEICLRIARNELAMLPDAIMEVER